jgi:Uma2 family endonuclease
LDLRLAKLTVEQVHAMVECGILGEHEPLELIDGLLVYKDRSDHGEDPLTIGKKHNLVVKLLARLDPELSPRGCHMQMQGPLSLPPHDEPEPDGCILKGQPRDYSQRLPTAGDVTCVIEVAESSLESDRETKLRLYARNGIEQYVIVNLRDDVLEVYEEPIVENQRYGSIVKLGRGDTVDLHTASAEDLRVLVADVLP